MRAWSRPGRAAAGRHALGRGPRRGTGRLALNVLGRYPDGSGAGPTGTSPKDLMLMFSKVAELQRFLAKSQPNSGPNAASTSEAA